MWGVPLRRVLAAFDQILYLIQMQNDKLLSSYQRCVSFSTAGGYNLLAIADFFKKKGYETRASRDVVHVSNAKKSGDIFFFNYGSFVCWGLKKSFEFRLLDYVKEFAVQPLARVESDQFYYYYGDETRIDTHEKLRLDIITLDSEDPQLKLAVSYGLSQSIKLETFEEAVKQAIQKNSNLPEEIAYRGSISLSRRAIFKRMGEIFIARSSINLSIEHLDAPEFFWRNPSLEIHYVMVKKFLDISSRVMALNQKIDLLQELLDILNSQVQYSQSTMLEGIVILLIAVEVIISLLQFHIV